MKSAQSNLAGYTSKVNAHISAMVNVQTNLKNAREAKKSAERDLEHMSANHPRELAAAEATIKERESSLAKLEKGADQLDIHRCFQPILFCSLPRELALKRTRDPNAKRRGFSRYS